LPAILVAGVIIFQPEIRRGFDRLGRTGVAGWLGRSNTEAVIEAVAVAAERMSEARHGGLIVFERRTHLRDIIETGVPVDARVSPELLTGIFFPNSPLHDMAVVMREDRVVAAGCVLPLANDLPLRQRGLGTRHRAAIGVTEQTDAVTLIVSEETGTISVAMAGRLTPVANEDRLRAVLAWLLEPTAVGSRSTGVPA
jgi:diadenylate cyclase